MNKQKFKATTMPTNLIMNEKCLSSPSADVRELFSNYWKELELYEEEHKSHEKNLESYESYPTYIDLGMGMPKPEMFFPELEAQDEFNKGQKSLRAEYQHQAGQQHLRKVIAQYERKRTGISYTKDNIMLVSGGLRGFSIVAESLAKTKKDTHFVGIVPTYPLLAGEVCNISETFGCKQPSAILPNDRNAFQITFEEVDRYIEPNTALYLTNPNNPTGRYVPSDVMLKIIKKCEEVNAHIILDQACDLPLTQSVDKNVWSDSPVIIRVISLSKTYLLAGYRLGYIVAHPDKITKLAKDYAFSDGNAPCVANKAIIKYLNNDRLGPFISSVSHRKVKLTLDLLADFDTVTNIIEPEACYYVFLKVNTSMCSWCIFQALLEQGVNIVPGCLFGIHKEPWIRICCGREDEVLFDHLDKLKKALCKL
jgi:aspartate aminotransferase